MRTSARMAGAVAAAAAIALLVSGCGSSDDNGGKDDAKPEATATAEKSEAPADDGPGTLPGIWKAEAEGKQYVLTIAGGAVTLLREKTNCTGRVLETGSEQSLALKCPGGTGEERTNGTVGSLKAKSMKVTWNGGATDTYAKVAEAPAELPKDPKDVEKLIPTN